MEKNVSKRCCILADGVLENLFASFNVASPDHQNHVFHSETLEKNSTQPNRNWLELTLDNLMECFDFVFVKPPAFILLCGLWDLVGKYYFSAH